MDDTKNSPTPVVDMPSGMSRAKIDPQGRIKLSAPYVKYFDAQPVRSVFVTSLDGKVAEIFPAATWQEMKSFLKTNRSKESAQRMAFTASRLGQDCDVDGQGRVTIHSELRAELGLDSGEELHIMPHNDNRIRILSAAMFASRMADCKAADSAADERELNEVGMP